MLEFFCDLPEGIRPEQYWQLLTNSTLNLTNIEIQHGTNLEYWADYIKIAKIRLKEVIISNPTNESTADYTCVI